MAVLQVYTFGQYSAGNPPYKPQPSPQGPSSAALTKFGDYQVSLFTGVPDISIPLYEIKSGSLSIPIVLKYHASGLKVTDVSGWVGLGWGLDAGGQVSRRMMGASEDENPSGGYLQQYIFPIASNFDVTDWDDQTYLDNHYNNYYDTEPDIYSYDFPGGSGKFFLNRHNNFQPEPILFTPATITRIGANESFEIIDENGNKYKYGTKEMTWSGYSSGLKYMCSAWKLDKVTAADPANTIDFVYNNQNSNTIVDDVQDTWVVDDHVICSNANGDPCYYTANELASRVTSNPQSKTTEQVLQEIFFRNGKVVFERAAGFRQDMPESKALSSIKIYQFDNTTQQYKIIKTISLLQSYFAVGTTASRLRLDAVHILDNGNNAVEKYTFDYNTLTLPATTSKARDWWGYYNGWNNSTLIPGQTIGFTEDNGALRNIYVGGGERNANSSYNQACMLTWIHYPTGGSTKFNFETNQFVEGGVTKLAGGLRIKSIESYDGIHTDPIVKTYEYNTARANYVLNNFYFMSQQTLMYFVAFPITNQVGLNAKKTRRTFMSSPSIDLVPYDQALVAYPVVTEYHGTVTNNTGKTIYTFTDMADLLASSVQSKPIIITNYYKRGLLKDKLVYKNTGGGSWQKVYQETNDYFAFSQKTIQDVGFVMFRDYVFEGERPYTFDPNYALAYFKTNYPIVTGDNYLKEKTITEYDQLNPSITRVTTTTYKYDNINHQQVTQVVTANSKGERLTTFSKYPLDYNFGGLTPTSADGLAVKNLQDKKIINALVERYQQVSNTDGSNAKITSGTYLSYHSSLPHIANAYQLNIKGPITNFTPSVINATTASKDNRYKLVMSFNQYDSYGNICEQQKANDVKEVFLWGYQSSYPVARVVGSDYNTVKNFVVASVLNAPASDIALRTELNKIRTGLAGTKSLINTYTYQPLIGMTSETDARERATFYEYDAFGRLAYIRDHENNIVKQICYSYQGQVTDCSQDATPLWQATGQTRCKPCAANQNYTVGITQNEERDNNTYSYSSGQTRWVDGASNPSCASPADWQNTTAPLTCRKNSLGNNTGEQLQEQKDMNPCSAIPNQTRLIVVGTNTTACPLTTTPVWQATGSTRCKPCAANSNYNLAILQAQEQDVNPNSSSLGQTRWVDKTGGSCVASPPDWQFTATPIRCRKAPGTSSNTGEQEREQQDMNPCSSSDPRTQWVVVGTNTTACPLPNVGVSSSNSRGIPGTVTFYRTGGGTGTYTFPIPVGGSFLGTIPVGTYNIVVSGAGTATYQVDNYPSQYASSLTLYDVPLWNSSCYIQIN